MQYEIYLTILLMKHFSYKYIPNFSKNDAKILKNPGIKLQQKCGRYFTKIYKIVLICLKSGVPCPVHGIPSNTYQKMFKITQ